MDPHFQALLDDASIAARKVKAVLDAVTGSQLTQEATRLVPGLAGLVGRLSSIAGIAGAASSAIPALEGAIAVYEALGGRPATVEEQIHLNDRSGMSQE